VSQNFKISALPWYKLTSTGVLQNYGASACSGGNNNDLFIFGGYEFESFTIKYDINNKHWTNITNIYSYCAISLPDETILYIGGIVYNDNGTDTLMPLNSLPLYDTASNTWKTSDKRIIIFGGQNDFPSVFGDLWILDIATNKWSVGKISNPNGLTLYSHTATLVDNYVIVAFGSYGGNNISSTIYLLDVSKRDSYTWVTKFIPNTTNFK
ncbi:40358_t:CDS:2, partial [Gigaspora margarita]